MSRPTLKLPAKSAPTERGEVRRPTVRPAPNRRSSPPKATPGTPFVAASPRPKPAPTPVKEKPAETAPAPAAKVYPKRGIARSSGARALPPARQRDEELPAASPSQSPSMPVASVAPAKPFASEAKRGKQPNDDLRPRLAYLITQKCGCSRREADDWIENDWIRVDGAVVNTLGIRVDPGAQIEISDAASQHQNERVTMLFHKPAGETDEAPTLKLFTSGNRWDEDRGPTTFKPTQRRGLLRVSRLADAHAGMLVFTQEESVSRRLTRTDSAREKEFLVEFEGTISEEGIEKLRRGLTLDGVRLKAAQVSRQNERQLRFVLRESLPQQIERMCELVGLQTAGIRLIRIGSVSLGKLPPGQWRYLRANERF